LFPRRSSILMWTRTGTRKAGPPPEMPSKRSTLLEISRAAASRYPLQTQLVSKTRSGMAPRQRLVTEGLVTLGPQASRLRRCGRSGYAVPLPASTACICTATVRSPQPVVRRSRSPPFRRLPPPRRLLSRSSRPTSSGSPANTSTRPPSALDLSGPKHHRLQSIERCVGNSKPNNHDSSSSSSSSNSNSSNSIQFEGL
jgi:hypothetical protein